MVSPFMAFAKGVLQGYNDNVAQEAQWRHEENLQRIANDGKTQVEGPEYYSVYGNQGGQPTSYNLFEMPDKKYFGHENERQEEILKRFYQATSVRDPRTGLTLLESLEDSDPEAYAQLLSNHDLLAHGWVNRWSKQDQESTQMMYRKGEVFALSKDHPLGDRFTQIAKGSMPLGNINDILVNYDAIDGSYIDRHPYDPEKYGYATKNEFLTAILKLNHAKGLGGKGHQAIDPYLVAYGDPNYWSAYRDLDETFQVIRNQGGWLDIDSKQKVYDVINSQKYTKFFNNRQGKLNVKRLHKLMVLGGSQHAHFMDAGPQYSYKLIRPDAYVKRVLGYEKGMGPIRQRVTAAQDAIFTIDKIIELYPNFNNR